MAKEKYSLEVKRLLFSLLLSTLYFFWGGMPPSIVLGSSQEGLSGQVQPRKPVVHDLLFQAQQRWQVTGQYLGQEMFDSLKLKLLIEHNLDLQGAQSIQSWYIKLNRNEFNTFVPQVKNCLKKQGLSNKFAILAVTCQPKQPSFFTYKLQGKKRYLYLPPADSPYLTYIPLSLQEDPELTTLKLHTTTPRCISKKIVSCLELLICPNKLQDQITAISLFENRIFFPYNISFSFPVPLLPLGDLINSSFYMSNLDPKQRRNEVSSTLCIPQGMSMLRKLTLPKNAYLNFEISAVPFWGRAETVFTIQVLGQNGTIAEFNKTFDLTKRSYDYPFVKTGLDISAYGEQTVKILLNVSLKTGNTESYQELPSTFVLIRNLKLSGLAKSQSPTPSHPDILIIVPDSLRAETAFDPTLLTPGKGLQYLMELQDTLVFTRAYSPSNTTTPSTNCLLHGKYLTEFPYYFYPAQKNNLFDYLQKNGYRTYCLTTNPYLIPKLEFFTDKYIFYNKLMDGDFLFKDAVNLLSIPDADQRPAAIFIQAMETHSPDDLNLVKQDLINKKKQASRLLTFLGETQQDQATVDLFKKIEINADELAPVIYKPISSSLSEDKGNGTLKFQNASALAWSFKPQALKLNVFKQHIIRIEFLVQCSSQELADKISSGTIQLFLPDLKNQLYNIGPPDRSSTDPTVIKIPLDLYNCLFGGPLHKRFPIQDYQGPGIIQIHFKSPASGSIQIVKVRVLYESSLLQKVLNKLKDKAKTGLSLPNTEAYDEDFFLTPHDLGIRRLAYRAKMVYFDFKFDVFLKKIYQQAEDLPVLFYFADHGQSLGEHKKYGHGSALYNQQINVPLVVHLPGKLSGSRRLIEEPAQTLDLYQTIAEIVKAPIGVDVRGRSMSDYAKTKMSKELLIPYPWVLSQIDPRENPFQVAMINEKIKVIADLQNNQLVSLYNTRTEPTVPFPPELYPTVKKIISIYNGLRKGAEVQESKRLDLMLDLNKKRLKDLGYID